MLALAYLLEQAGREGKALRSHEEVVCAAIRICDPEHFEVIRVRNNLAEASSPGVLTP